MVYPTFNQNIEKATMISDTNYLSMVTSFGDRNYSIHLADKENRGVIDKSEIVSIVEIKSVATERPARVIEGKDCPDALLEDINKGVINFYDNVLPNRLADISRCTTTLQTLAERLFGSHVVLIKHECGDREYGVAWDRNGEGFFEDLAFYGDRGMYRGDNLKVYLKEEPVPFYDNRCETNAPKYSAGYFLKIYNQNLGQCSSD